MILEFIVSSALQEWFTRKFKGKFKGKSKNNLDEIKKLRQKTANEVRSVGDLKKILDCFADDVPLGNEFNWYHVQLLEIKNKGSLHIGQITTYGK